MANRCSLIAVLFVILIDLIHLHNEAMQLHQTRATNVWMEREDVQRTVIKRMTESDTAGWGQPIGQGFLPRLGQELIAAFL